MRAKFSLAWQCAALALGTTLAANAAGAGFGATFALGTCGALAIAALIFRKRAREERALDAALKSLTAHADELVTHADGPAAHANEPAAHADQPVTRTGEPIAHADELAAHTNQPTAHADQFAARTDGLAARTNRPVTRTDEPITHTDKPAARAGVGANSNARGWRELSAPIARRITETARLLRVREARAAAEQERLLAILNNMVEGVLVLGADGRTLLANRPLRGLFNVWGEVRGKSALELLRRADVDEALARAAACRAPVQRVVRGVGEPARVLEMHAVRFPKTGAAAGTVAVFHDVSELHRLERVRRDFVANISHELRTPLTAIRGFTETLLGGAVPPADRRAQLEIIQRHSERLGALIEDLLELSRIEAERRTLDTEPVPLRALALTLLRDLRPRLRAGNFAHTLEIQDDLHVRADRRALERVLGNLLDNALHYTRPGGALRITARAAGARVRIEIADTGIGLGDADRARLFERFYRGGVARGMAPGGSGLGLSIVKHLVQAMGGEVSAHDEPEGGARFCVVLAEAPPPAGTSPTPPPAGARAN